MSRSLLLSLMIWLVEILFVTALVSDEWLRSVQRSEDTMIVSYLGATKDRQIRQDAQHWFDTL